MKLSRLIFVIAAIIVGAWLLGLILRAAAWIISALVGLAAIIVIIGVVSAYFENKKRQK